MGLIDLEQYRRDDVTIVFGTQSHSINAYTLANSLVALSDAALAIAGAIDPDDLLEIEVVGYGDGSFKVKLKKVRKGLGGFFQRGAENLLWAYLALTLIEKSPEIVINVDTDGVQIQYGADRVVVPKEVWENTKRLIADPKVDRNVRKAIDTLQSDSDVKSLGVTPSFEDSQPMVLIPRSSFPAMTANTIALPAEELRQSRRLRSEKVRLYILKAWLKQRKRKWSFEWNGVPLSAAITDEGFWNRLNRREILIGVGDALDVVISYRQFFDETLGIYVNDTNSFEIVEVVSHVIGGTASLPGI